MSPTADAAAVVLVVIGGASKGSFEGFLSKRQGFHAVERVDFKNIGNRLINYQVSCKRAGVAHADILLLFTQ
jgi:hypothetical protein